MTPFDLIVWALAFGLAIIVICFGIAVGVLLIESARKVSHKETTL